MLISSFIAFTFYKSIFAVIIFSPFCIIYIKDIREKLIRERKWELNLQFREGLMSISSALNAGYSIENAFWEAKKDLRLMYEEETYIIKEFEYIVNQLGMNRTVEEVLIELADRSNIDDINNFTEVFITAKRTGGDIIKIIKRTSKTIGDKIEIKREILTLITAKKLEARIMNLMPLGIILYMWMFSPGFLDPLYDNIIGRIIMTICLLLYLLAYKLSENIINIQV